MKRGGLGIPDPRLSEGHAYNASKASSEFLLGSLPGGTDLNYVANKGYVRQASDDRPKQREFLETVGLTRRKELADGAGLNPIR